MSRIGRQPIELPSGVEVTIGNQEVKVKGKRGELARSLHPDVRLEQKENSLAVSLPESLSKKRALKAKALWGLTRTLLWNMVQGVTDGFEKRLEIEGTGYRAAVQGDSLELSLGFSHPVALKIPDGLSCLVEKNVITVSGINNELVGDFAAKIRRLRPVEPYKGKGVKYQGEYVKRKEGKKAGGADAGVK